MNIFKNLVGNEDNISHLESNSKISYEDRNHISIGDFDLLLLIDHQGIVHE